MSAKTPDFAPFSSLRWSIEVLAMIAKGSLWHRTQCVLRRQCQARPSDRRGLAAVASGSFNYQVGDASGLKYASRDLPGPTTHLAVVAKAGSRYQPLPGWSDGLEQFAFKVSILASSFPKIHPLGPTVPDDRQTDYTSVLHRAQRNAQPLESHEKLNY